MRTQLLTWRSSLYASLGLAAFACGGQTERSGSTVHSETGGTGGANVGGTGVGGWIPDFGGAGGMPGGRGGSAGAAGSGGIAGAAGSGGIAGAFGSGGGGFGGTAAGTGGTPPINLACDNPQPRLGADGKETGFVSCAAGFLHRPERRECASSVPRPDPIAVPSDGGVGCTRDEDCSDQRHGHCVLSESVYPRPYSFCRAGCVRDEECEPGWICLCGDPVGVCVSANCTLDANCEPGLLCTSSLDESPCGGSYPSTFTCQRPTDACRGQADCAPQQNCRPDVAGRQCGSFGACGRPFLIGGEPRLAELATRSTGWSGGIAPSPAQLDPAARAALVEHWSRNGLMEHASVGAFARFTLELLALGAPAFLVRAAQQALGDEIAHAELCFGLASAYAGSPIEPGALPVHGALAELSAVDVVGTAIAEACIGETLAAVEAAEACAHARDPQVRAVLERIAADEARHAELGWMFLRWALASASPALREQLRRQTARLVAAEIEQARNAASPASDLEPELLAHGVLSPALRSEARRTALEQLVSPLSRALFDAPCSTLAAAQLS